LSSILCCTESSVHFAYLLPVPPEVTHRHLGHEVVGVDVQALEGVLLVIPALIALNLQVWGEERREGEEG
jgi:hypothetical protein